MTLPTGDFRRLKPFGVNHVLQPSLYERPSRLRPKLLEGSDVGPESEHHRERLGTTTRARVLKELRWAEGLPIGQTAREPCLRRT